MSNNHELLEEYEQVNKELENIRNQIVDFKHKTQEKLKSVQSEDEEMSIFLEYKNQVDKFAQDKNTKKKYKNLQKRKSQLESSLLKINDFNKDDEISEKSDCESSDILTDINILIKKYKKFVKVPIHCKNNNVVCSTNVKSQTSKEKCDDDKHMKKLYSLINSLKLDVDI